MSNLILFLDSPEVNPEVAGGKGANLSQMALAGFSVPAAFIITTTAYKAFIQGNGLEERIAGFSRSALAGSPKSLEDASRSIRQLFYGGTIPYTTIAAINQAYNNLSHARESEPSLEEGIEAIDDSLLSVAVRSSATAEDLPNASFAGQQETYLNVRGEQALINAVRRCWASLWTARAIAYRAHQRINCTDLSLAVVVQRMVAANAAGVLFTINPLSGNREEVVINAVWGLGEAVVSGQVTPDTTVTDKSSGKVKSVEIGDKAVMIVPAVEGTAELPTDSRQRRLAVLTPEQAAELTRLGREIEAHFGSPQDIEWAIADEQIYVVQSRPVTAVSVNQSIPDAEKVRAPGDDDWPALGKRLAHPFDLWTRANVGEYWPSPVSPLTWSNIPLTFNEATRLAQRGLKPYLDNIQWVERFYGRIYHNDGAMAHILSEEYGLPGSLLDSVWGSRRINYVRQDVGFHPFRFLLNLPFILRQAAYRRGVDQKLESLFPQIDSWADEFRDRSLAESSDYQLWTELTNIWMERYSRVLNLQIAVNGAAFVSFVLLEWLVTHWCHRKDLAQDLIAGLSGIDAAEIGPAIYQIAELIRDLGLNDTVTNNRPEEVLARLRQMPDALPVLRMLDTFFQRYGHRCPNEGDWIQPRWAEEPKQVIELVVGYLRAEHQLNFADAEDRQQRRRAEAFALVQADLGPIRWAIFQRVLRQTQKSVRLRDNGKHYLMKVALPVCRIYRALGQRWANRNLLEQSEDIFFLTVSDIEVVIDRGDRAVGCLDLPTLVAERRQAFNYWFSVEAPEVIGPDGQPLTEEFESESTVGRVLQGIPASGGRVQGRARIVSDPQNATRLQKNDILVTRATDPGWTPIFPLVGGLVLEIGGQLSHGAIVAREYGVPAVVNVREATRRIQDGQLIIVDGSAGRVFLDV